MTQNLQSTSAEKLSSKSLEYQHAGTKLIGQLAYDESSTKKRPGVLVYPEWWGLTEFPRGRAEELAKLGFVALAADMYGGAKIANNADEAKKYAGELYGDKKTMRARAAAAMETLKKSPNVDPQRIAAIGYCFGGTCALELARSGADLAVVVSFHGDLSTDNPAQEKTFKPKVLICSGGDDAFVSDKAVTGFQDEMRKGKADWQVIVYGGAHHAFTNPDADKHGIPNIAYHAAAAKRSWLAMRNLFEETFGPVR